MLNSHETKSILMKVLQLTQTMQKKADSGLWEEMVETDQQRQQLIDSVFPIEESHKDINQLLTTIIDLNKELEMQCQQAKQKMHFQLSEMNKHKKALNAYQSK